MSNFVDEQSVVRKVWGSSDMILLIFAGSAAEFALNRAVDWLFFTGKIPRDPVGRLFSTVRYAQQIVFAGEAKAETTIERINASHKGVEHQRGRQIPAWSFRDVLYMLIDYTARAYELLDGPLKAKEREEIYSVFSRIGRAMHIPELPPNHRGWVADRERHLARDLVYSDHTRRLFDAYRRALGLWRYELLLRVQAEVVPEAVGRRLKLERQPVFTDLFTGYRLMRGRRVTPLIERMLIPSQYLEEVRKFDWSDRQGFEAEVAR